ncbi:type I methionyl aminopeptidase [Ructibacterium gallinarum]|uniref:Methionine aminopeptidase n=1 Tax=Ructibacterium gallinarum TaxID=2779355 RepID=A0A9D5R802_9FIRM|nr:type I methionyl aminopeptidase [Ructibacterium gallinarum]MBE5038919.1 type I methionyl aminopeptidase [Ructibacterium gallinarum]
MVAIKSKSEIEKMKVAGRITYETLEAVRKAVKPGVTTMELDRVAENYIRSQGCTASFKGYGGFPGSICASVNDEIIHGFPGERVLEEGDIVSVDVGACYKGYHGDACRTFAVGKIAPETQRLLDVTKQSFFEALAFAREGYRISDISRAVQEYVEKNGYSVLRNYCGHGVGADLHEDPEVPNYVTHMRGIRLRAGMCLAIEPMVCQGAKEYYVSGNEWTVCTRDGKMAAHYENSVLITSGDPYLLTLPEANRR